MAFENSLEPRDLVNQRWEVISKIGCGGYGEVYKGQDITTKEYVALKVESKLNAKKVLKMEIDILKKLQGQNHICRLIDFGANDKFAFLVMQLQGKNLLQLKKAHPMKSFSVSTTMRLGHQILKAIESIHSIGILHRDIKPSNFVIGSLVTNYRQIFMLDFGLSKYETSVSHESTCPQNANVFGGTIAYASLNALKNQAYGRQDDLWSLFYMLVELSNGSLPWKYDKDKNIVRKKKQKCDHRKLLKKLPADLEKFLDHLQSLEYSDRPDYCMLIGIFENWLKQWGIEEIDPYDWERVEASNVVPSELCNDHAQLQEITTTTYAEHDPTAVVETDYDNFFQIQLTNVNLLI